MSQWPAWARLFVGHLLDWLLVYVAAIVVLSLGEMRKNKRQEPTKGGPQWP